MTREQLLASLTVGDEDNDSVYLSANHYIDWSVSTEDGRSFEVGEGDSATNLELSWIEIERLHRALTLTLLNRAQG